LTEVRYVGVKREGNDWLFVDMDLVFSITNMGRVAAYKWALVLQRMNGNVEDRTNDYLFDIDAFPMYRGGTNLIRTDPTILPTMFDIEKRRFGIYLRPNPWDAATIQAEFERLLPSGFRLGYRVVTETSPGDVTETTFGDVLDYADVLRRILERI
jgi:hypothetical protein